MDGINFECSGQFEGEGEDEWLCSEGVEAHRRYGWKMPTFIIDEGREANDVHVKIWREEVLIFDDAIDISWQNVNTSSMCEVSGCWSGNIRATIQSFDSLVEED